MCRHFSATSKSCCLINGSPVCSARSSHSSALARYSSTLLVTMRLLACTQLTNVTGEESFQFNSGKTLFFAVIWSILFLGYPAEDGPWVTFTAPCCRERFLLNVRLFAHALKQRPYPNSKDADAAK